MDRPTPTTTGETPPAPLGYPPLIINAVFEEYFEAQAWDGTAAYGNTLNVAKSPELRESVTGFAVGAADDLITALPLRVTVRNDADDADVVCEWIQVSGGGAIPPGGLKYQGLFKQADNGAYDWDWARAFDDS